MKKYSLAIILIPTTLLMISATKLLPCIGIYEAKPVVMREKEVFSKERIIHWKAAQLVDSKPVVLTLDPELEKLKGIKFGSIRLGNNEKETWLVVRKDDFDYYSEIYIDQNMDNNITIKEKLQDIDTFQVEEHGFTFNVSRTAPKPIPLLVSYKGSNGTIKKKLDFYIQTEYVLKKKSGDTSFLYFINATAFEGRIKVTEGAGYEKDYRFRLIDANSNGCYNDFEKDYLLMDLNLVGKFKNDESQPLGEYFAVKEKGKKKQLRLVVFPYPAKIGVFESTNDFQSIELESQTNDELTSDDEGKSNSVDEKNKSENKTKKDNEKKENG